MARHHLCVPLHHIHDTHTHTHTNTPTPTHTHTPTPKHTHSHPHTHQLYVCVLQVYFLLHKYSTSLPGVKYQLLDIWRPWCELMVCRGMCKLMVQAHPIISTLMYCIEAIELIFISYPRQKSASLSLQWFDFPRLNDFDCLLPITVCNELQIYDRQLQSYRPSIVTTLHLIRLDIFSKNAYW